MHRKHLTKLISLSTLAIMILLLPAMAHNEPFLIHMLILAGIYTILATSLHLVYLTNVWFVGTAAFYAIGAYAYALLAGGLGLSFWLCLPLVGIGVAIIALGFGYVTLRVRGIYFAILSIAFVEAVRLMFANTLGSRMVIMAPAPSAISIPHLLTIDFVSKTDYYYLMLVLVAIVLITLYRIERSPIAAVFKAIAQNQPLAESLGIKTIRYEVLALCVHACFASIAGVFLAAYNSTVSPDSFTVWASMVVLILMVVGGMGSLWGPVIGAVLLTVLPEYLPVTPFIKNISYAGLVIICLYFLPGGLISLVQVIQERVGWLRTRGLVKAKPVVNVQGDSDD